MKTIFDLKNTEIGEAIVSGNNTHGFWVYKPIQLAYIVTVQGVELLLAYSNGHYSHNDYQCQSNQLDVEVSSNTDDFLIKLVQWQCYDDSLEDNEELLELMKDHNLKLSEQELINLRQEILDNTPNYRDYMEDREDEFKIKNIKQMECGFLEVTFSHNIVELFKAEDEDAFWGVVKDFGDYDYTSNWLFFRHLFYKHENKEIVSSFFDSTSAE